MINKAHHMGWTFEESNDFQINRVSVLIIDELNYKYIKFKCL